MASENQIKFVLLGSCASVAQLDRASASEAEGQAFESLRVYKRSALAGLFLCKKVFSNSLFWAQ